MSDGAGPPGGLEFGDRWSWYRSRDRLAVSGIGFGGHYPIVIPEPDIEAVVTAWNTPPERPAVDGREVLEWLPAAVRGRRSPPPGTGKEHESLPPGRGLRGLCHNNTNKYN